MAGSTLYDTATLAVVAQMNAANLPFFTQVLNNGLFGQNPNFNVQANYGGSTFSPDGATVYGAFNTAATGQRPLSDVLYVANATGSAEPKVAARLQGIGGNLLGFTPDGNSLLYFSSQLGGDVLQRLPLDGSAAVELARGPTGMQSPSLSPDGRRFAYHTNKDNKNEIWVRPIGETGELGTPIRVGDGLGMADWRSDGAELYYVGANRELMSAPVRTSPTLAVGAPRRLFDMPKAIPVAAGFDGRGDVTADGGKVVVQVPPRIPPPAQTEMRVVDRTGKVVATPGKPGTFFGRPIISPDGTKVLAGITEQLEDIFELWVYDLTAGTEKRLMSDRNLNSWIFSEPAAES